MAERSRTGADQDDGGFTDRAVWLETTIGGAGRLAGDLTPAGAAALSVVLDALSGKAGPEVPVPCCSAAMMRWRRPASG